MEEYNTIEIKPEQMSFADSLAKKLVESYKGSNGNFGGNPTYSRAYLGFLAETVVCDYYHKPRPKVYAIGGDEYDIRLNELNFDIKCSTFIGFDKFLRVNIKEALKPTVEGYILTSIEENNVLVYGWASKKEVLEGEQKDFGYGLNYILPVQNLHNMDELKSGQLMLSDFV